MRHLPQDRNKNACPSQPLPKPWATWLNAIWGGVVRIEFLVFVSTKSQVGVGIQSLPAPSLSACSSHSSCQFFVRE